MPRGRAPIYASEKDRLEARRDKVRDNVRRWRSRQTALRPKPEAISQQQHDASADELEKPFLAPQVDLAGGEKESGQPGSGFSKKPTSTSTSRRRSPPALEFLSPSPGGPALVNGLVHRDLFLQRLLDSCMPSNGIEIPITSAKGRFHARHRDSPCRGWMMAAYHSVQAGQNGLLRNSMLTVSLFISAAEQRDSRVMVVARNSYQKQLVLVRRLLTTSMGLSLAPDGSKQPDLTVIMTCLWLALTEVVASHTLIGYETHLSGISDILKCAGPQCLWQSQPQSQSSAEAIRTVYFEHRLMCIASACMREEAPFFTDPSWLQFPGREACALANTPLNKLADVACHLLLVLQDLRLSNGNIHHSQPLTKGSGSLLHLLTRSQHVSRQLAEWHEAHYGGQDHDTQGIFFADDNLNDNQGLRPSSSEDRDRNQEPWSSSFSSSESFPPSTTITTATTTIHFSHFTLAMTLLWYHAFQVQCAQLIARICQLLTSSRHSDSVSDFGSHSDSDSDSQQDRWSGGYFYYNQTRTNAVADIITSANFICRSMEYMCDARRGLAGSMIGYFPICTALRGLEYAATTTTTAAQPSRNGTRFDLNLDLQHVISRARQGVQKIRGKLQPNVAA